MTLYSRALSDNAREKLIEFIEAYLKSLKSMEVDEQAEIAKQKASEVFQTDIDILAFVTTIVIMHGQAVNVVVSCMNGVANERNTAALLVELTERAREYDRRFRPGGA